MARLRRPRRSSSVGRDRTSRHDRSFTLVELLVVIGIIALLASILLVALKGANAKARRTDTLMTLQAFKSACETYRQEQGEYPGVIPEALLAAANGADAAGVVLTGTENAMLALLGGYRLVKPSDGPVDPSNPNPAVQAYVAMTGPEVRVVFNYQGWQLKADPRQIGQGPIINGKAHEPYLTLRAKELRVLTGQRLPGGAFGAVGDPLLPDLADAWGQPVLYGRRISPNGPLVGNVPAVGSATPRPQFSMEALRPYIQSEALGDLAKHQDPTQANLGSLLNKATFTGGPTPAGVDARHAALAQIIRSPSFGKAMIDATTVMSNLEARGDFFLISAGPDGYYFSVSDGPGTVATPVTNIATHPEFGTPQVVDEYDDVRLFGGG